MVVFGLAFHEGRYIAAVAERGQPEANDAKSSAPGSLEWACHATGIPRFILDLRSAAADSGASAWLAQPLLMRNIGTQVIPGGGFTQLRVGQYFDSLLYFDHTTPSALLK